jgi:hypothetical protein
LCVFQSAASLDEKFSRPRPRAQRNKLSLVTYLVQNKLVKSRVLAEFTRAAPLACPLST